MCQVIVQGIPSVARAVINEETPSQGSSATKYHLLVEGYGLADVMGAPGVKGSETKSNHIIEVSLATTTTTTIATKTQAKTDRNSKLLSLTQVEHVLGIEAARQMISEEISYIMSAYGITIDKRHLMLLSDVMTFKVKAVVVRMRIMFLHA